jgi:hypothetical protein
MVPNLSIIPVAVSFAWCVLITAVPLVALQCEHSSIEVRSTLNPKVCVFITESVCVYYCSTYYKAVRASKSSLKRFKGSAADLAVVNGQLMSF